MIREHSRSEILRRLARTEEEHGVRILFAIESGSRAWGFVSPNSDYDVRFIYAREPSWYQAVDLEERRDVIDYPIVDDIDINGWDVRKTLRLYWQSNPAFVEWIKSPITYIENSGFRAGVLSMLPSIYAPEKGIYHYRSMAKTNYRGYLREAVWQYVQSLIARFAESTPLPLAGADAQPIIPLDPAHTTTPR